MNLTVFSEVKVGIASVINIKHTGKRHAFFKPLIFTTVMILSVMVVVLAHQQKASALIPGASWGAEPGSTINVQDIGSGRTRIDFNAFVDKSNPDTVIPTDRGIAIKRFYYVVVPGGDPYNYWTDRVDGSFTNPAFGLTSFSEGDVGAGQSREMYEIGNQTTFYCVHADGGSTGGCGSDQSVRNDWFIVNSSSPFLSPGYSICAQILLTEHHDGGAPDYGGWALFDTSDPVGASYYNSFWTLSEANCYTIPSAPSVYSLNVNSSGASGVPISGSAATYSGSTNYTLTGISTGTTFTLTAPATASGNNFSSWTGCTSTNAAARTCTITVTSNGTVTVTYTAPPLSRLTCSFSPISFTVNIPERVNVTLSNPNTSTSVAITSSSWSVPSANAPNSGVGATYNSGISLNGSGGGVSVPAATGSGPGQLTLYSAAVVTINSSGNHSITWNVVANPASLSPLNCNDASAIDVAAQPYVRFFGNDVIAGGGYGSMCTPNTSARLRTQGGYKTALGTTGDFIGSASELAAFAGGQITGLIAGSQIDRSASQLVFANTPLPSSPPSFPVFDTNPTPNLGGGFNTFGCTPELEIRDSYETFTSDQTFGGLTLNASDRITRVVQGDVYINDNIVYNGAGWGSVGDIPLFRIYATGNIYIRGNVTQLDGLYSAQGDIYTCANGAGRYALADMVANCSSRLTFNGAVVANNLILDRVVGSVGGSQGTAESVATTNAAEVFNFSPEMYLAIYDDGQSGGSSVSFDSILSLPPAL